MAATVGRRSLAIIGAAAAIVMFGWTASAAPAKGFDLWLVKLRAEAQRKGVRPATLDAALAGVKPIPQVIAHLEKQPEFTLTLNRYLQIVVTPERIKLGRQNLKANRVLLRKVSRRYGVPAQFIVALWGIETKYGAITGKYPVVGALATLAYQGSRRSYFRKELINALKILDQGHIAVKNMKGSWAGAMGQNQFMPTSFLNYAVDFNGDGRRDIWLTRADVLGSTANYLHREGWRVGETWGREVKLPAKLPAAIAAGKTLPLRSFARAGVRRINGRPLPRANIKGRLVRPEGANGRAFLTYANYRVILRWNRSDFFAIAVGTLADRIIQK
jgi:membrane-bound lytic murein transglycosylase B